MLQLRSSVYSRINTMINHQNTVAFTLLLTNNIYIYRIFKLSSSYFKSDNLLYTATL